MRMDANSASAMMKEQPMMADAMEAMEAMDHVLDAHAQVRIICLLTSCYWSIILYHSLIMMCA